MTKFRPCIDLHDGKVKQIVGSSLSDNGSGLKTNFETDMSAAAFAEMYKRDGVKGGHVIMLGKGNEAAAKAALAAYEGGLQVGGGITAVNAKEYLDAGAAMSSSRAGFSRTVELDIERLRLLTTPSANRGSCWT
jgi:Phosphoribosylformimino-5-aminoimidazole carboxamide ribonucleotide (ProFAR) isomerase